MLPKFDQKLKELGTVDLQEALANGLSARIGQACTIEIKSLKYEHDETRQNDSGQQANFETVAIKLVLKSERLRSIIQPARKVEDKPDR
jgi:hypothetical protein